MSATARTCAETVVDVACFDKGELSGTAKGRGTCDCRKKVAKPAVALREHERRSGSCRDCGYRELVDSWRRVPTIVLLSEAVPLETIQAELQKGRNFTITRSS